MSRNFKKEKVGILCVNLLLQTHNHTHTHTYPDTHTEESQNGSNMPTNRFIQKLVRSDLSRFRENLRVFRFSWLSEVITTKS